MDARESAVQRMKAWKDLPLPKVDWESFKRMVGQMGVDKAVSRSKKIQSKKLPKRSR
jgi:hypothetical protein